MTYKLIDRYTEKVLGEFATKEQAEKAETHLVHEDGARYEIKAPAKAKKAKKVVSEESD
tara:strand:+ start:210 stop:386 length:177 start_codon:yes stop_codon:yes gene_type:complete